MVSVLNRKGDRDLRLDQRLRASRLLTPALELLLQPHYPLSRLPGRGWRRRGQSEGKRPGGRRDTRPGAGKEAVDEALRFVADDARRNPAHGAGAAGGRLVHAAAAAQPGEGRPPLGVSRLARPPRPGTPLLQPPLPPACRGLTRAQRPQAAFVTCSPGQGALIRSQQSWGMPMASFRAPTAPAKTAS